MTITQESLKQYLHYDPISGIFTWVKTSSPIRIAGQRAGTINKRGYRAIQIERHIYPEHRLAFIYMLGRLPMATVDHRNCITSDNRWENLREASASQNNSNTRLYKNNSTGFKGVCWHRRVNKYQASIRLNYKPIHLGYFDSAEDAYNAYCAAAKSYFGEYARFG